MATLASSTAPQSPAPRTPGHSPVPYLFTGLAAMLGLIAFAILVLACSYWKLSGLPQNRDDDGERDLETGEADGGAKTAPPPPPPTEEKYLVIMAGQEKPTYLATPISSRASSFGSKRTVCSSSSSSGESNLSEEEYCVEKKMENGLIEIGNMEAHQAVLDRVH